MTKEPSQHHTNSAALIKHSAEDDQQLLKVLRLAWRAPFSLQSDFARRNSAYIAMAACKGLITTRISRGLYGQRWLITAVGMRLINEKDTQ